MGVLYRATDLKLGRSVAIKLLARHLVADETAINRFIREARAASALDHPNIGTVHDICEHESELFIVMTLYEGETLKQRLEKEGRFAVPEAANVLRQMALGLEAAHRAGIVHRDIKPANVLVTPSGTVKLLDFGLAKLASEIQGQSMTQAGQTMGTLLYMSPEQLRGEPVDARSDLWSLGVVAYEILSGACPFQADSSAATALRILNDEPPSLTAVPGVPAWLSKLVAQLLRKAPSDRQQTASEVLEELKRAIPSAAVPFARAGLAAIDLGKLWRKTRRPKVAVPALLILLAIAAASGWAIHRASRIRWARQTMLPEAHRLADKGEHVAAYDLALQAERYIPKDPRLAELWQHISIPLSVRTDPPGADIDWRPYATRGGEWRHAGRSPLEGYRVPLGLVRLKLVKEGFAPVEGAVRANNARGGVSLKFKLDTDGSAPAGMVRVTSGRFGANFSGIGSLGPVDVPDFWIDRYEVTNRQFKDFVDAGGYRDRRYWAHAFIKDGRLLSWEQAMTEFRDTTGRPGPAGWEAGGFPNGQADFPVTGVSWYEAAAYASFVGKSLPTVYHWLYAAADVVPDVLGVSNFSGEGLARVGSFPGLGTYGTYDMAGNAREWSWNEGLEGSEARRYILGGSWGEPTYKAGDGDLVPPFDRSRINGFRCVKYIEANDPPERLTAPIERRRLRDYSKEKPVSDEVFEVYKRLYNYESSELNPALEAVDASAELWRREKVSFDAAYGGERVIAHLFLPKAVPPPYQTVIYFPGSMALQLRSSDELYFTGRLLVDVVIRSGRAFVYPVYKGMHERLEENASSELTAYRDHMIQWRKDLSRTIDYLETRKEIDARKLAYYGFSLGASGAALILALENRLKVAVLEAGGLHVSRTYLPEADLLNFLPRIQIPVLMLSGRYDTVFPIEFSQIPMYRLLGTPESDKRHVILDGSHGLSLTARNEVIRETLDWLDHYLGPVQTRAPRPGPAQ